MNRIQTIDFQALLEGIDAITWEMDVSTWIFTYVSPQAEPMLGYPLDRWYEPGFWNEVLVHPDDAAWATRFCATQTEQMADHNFEYRAVRPDGRVVWLRDLVRVVDRPGQAPLLRGVMVDITAEKAAEARAEDLRRELLEAQRLAHIGSWQWVVDEDRVTWTDELYRIFGLEPDTFGASFGNYLGLVHPEDRERVERTIASVANEGGDFDFEERVIRPDGSVRHLRSRGHAVEEAGRVVRLVGSCQDITEQKAAQARERELAAARAKQDAAERERSRLQNMFEQAPAAIAVLAGPELTFQVCNNTMATLLGGRDVLGKPLREAMPEIEDQGFVELASGVYRSGTRFVGREYPARFRRGDGTEASGIFDFVYEPLLNDDGSVYAVMCHATDITERIEGHRQVAALAEQLKTTNAELKQFAYVTSHDLRAPLRGLSSLANWIEEDLEVVPPQVQGHIDLMKSRVVRLQGLIDGILAYSRAGRRLQEPERVDVRALLDSVIDLLAPPAGVVSVEGDFPTLMVERIPFSQVLQNLIGNAVKHGACEAPRVVVRCSDAGDAWEFSFSDNGPGIAPQFHERIFTIFQTLKPRDEVEGSGVGLALVKKIVESRGGSVRVESTAGSGATFLVRWPKE